MTAIIFDVVAALAAIGALILTRGVHLPAGMFWTTGFGLVALAAGFDAARLAGAEIVAQPQAFIAELAWTVGSASWLLAGLFGFILRFPDSLAALGGAVGMVLLIALSQGSLPPPGWSMPAIAGIGLAVAALVGLRSQRTAALWLIAALGLGLLAGLARAAKLEFVPLSPRDLYHLLLAPMLLCLAAAARHHG